jgi:hypothetical protein
MSPMKCSRANSRVKTRKKISCPNREWNPGCSSPYPGHCSKFFQQYVVYKLKISSLFCLCTALQIHQHCLSQNHYLFAYVFTKSQSTSFDEPLVTYTVMLSMKRTIETCSPLGVQFVHFLQRTPIILAIRAPVCSSIIQ